MIKSASSLIGNAVKKLGNYKTGKISPIKTRYDHINEACLGGIFTGMILTIGGISGSGKSYLVQQIEEDMFNKDLNPDCDDYVLLRCAWEMSVFKLLMRRAKRTLKKTMSHILFGEFSKEERNKFQKICDLEKSGNIFYMEDPCSPTEWEEQVREFLTTHSNKKHVLISIDHVALTKDSGDKKRSIDGLMESINTINKEFDNVSFIPLTQLNRKIEERTDVRQLAPIRSDIYASDTTFHISDIVLIVHNPYKLGHYKYMVVSGLAKNEKEEYLDGRYEYLREFMDKPDNRKTSFLTKNTIFHHFIKTREIDDTIGNLKDIFAIKLDMSTVSQKEMEENLLVPNDGSPF